MTEINLGNIQAKEIRRKTVKPQGNGAMILVPKDWIGKEVIVILDEDEKMEKVNYKIYEHKNSHRVRGVKVEGQQGWWITSQAQWVNNHWETAGCNYYNQEQIETILNTEAEVVEEGKAFLQKLDDPDLEGKYVLIGFDENGLEYFIS